jgi:hypothetical protein
MRIQFPSRTDSKTQSDTIDAAETEQASMRAPGSRTGRRSHGNPRLAVESMSLNNTMRNF